MRGFETIRKASDLKINGNAVNPHMIARKIIAKGYDKRFPILIDPNNTVLAGRRRAAACQQINPNMEVPVYVATEYHQTELEAF